MPTKKVKRKQPVYRFNTGVSVDPKDEHEGARFEEGDEVAEGALPPHINLKALLKGGDVSLVEDE